MPFYKFVSDLNNLRVKIALLQFDFIINSYNASPRLNFVLPSYLPGNNLDVNIVQSNILLSIE